MYLIFFDESKNDNTHPSYHLGAVVVLSEHLLSLEGQVNSIARDVFGDARLSKETEFHASDIFHRTRAFKSWNDFGKRLDVLNRLLIVLGDANVGRIFIQINDDLLSPAQSAEDIAFMFLVERANDLMRSRKALGILIGDRESDTSAARHAVSLSDYKANGTDFAFGREITSLVDSVHFTHSHLSRFLQLADIYAWVRQFQVRNHGSENARHKAVFELLRGVDLGPSKYKEWPKRS